MTAYHEAAGYRSLVLALSLLELIASSPPSRPRFGTIHGGFQQIATTDVQLFPKELVEKVVKLHFPALGAGLTGPLPENKQFSWLSRLKALSRIRTKVTEQSGFSRWSCVVRFIFTVLHGVTVLASGRLLNLCCSTFLSRNQMLVRG